MADETMTVEVAFPPNYQAVCDAFPWVARTPGIIFAWGLQIFNPDGIHITPALRAHEEVHSLRQQGNPAAWWDKYLSDPAFRYAEEIPAHICEYAKLYSDNPLRNARRHYLDQVAERLAGPLYGRLTTRERAIRLLKTGARVLLDPQPQGV